MKFIKTLFFLCLFINAKSQSKINKPYSLAQESSSLIATFLSGAADGTAETLVHHYYKFNEVFPNNNPQYWNPDLSWTNKYKNGDINQGPKFFGSTNVLVWTTSGYHMTRFARNTLLVTAITLHPFKEKKKLKYHLIDIALHTAAYHAGFKTTYNLIFK